MTLKSVFKISILFLVSWTSLSTFAAPPKICGGFEQFQDSCLLSKQMKQLEIRSQALSKKMNMKINPFAFRQAVATRFIDRQDWVKATQSGILDPNFVYNPAPVTWQQWQKVAFDLVQKSAELMTPLTPETLKMWNRTSISKGASLSFMATGNYTTGVRYGKNIDLANAISASEVGNLKNFRFSWTNEHLLDFVPLICEDELGARKGLPSPDPICQQSITNAKKNRDKNAYLKMLDNDYTNGIFFFVCSWKPTDDELKVLLARNKVCGAVSYPRSDIISFGVDAIVKMVNEYISSTKFAEDPLQFALQAQRELVGLHPFGDGNGRTSRFLMDYITFALGLPPILIQNMDKDLSTELSKYVAQGRKGAHESISLMNQCLGKWEAVDPRNTSQVNQLQRSLCGFI
jgi:hypothetical protein